MNFTLVDENLPSGCIYELDFNSELDSYSFSEDHFGPPLQNQPLRKEYFINHNTPILYDIVSQLNNFEFFSSAFSHDSKTVNTFTKEWPIAEGNKIESIKDFFTDLCYIDSTVTVDSKEYNLGFHFDNRCIVANFIVNLSDNHVSTQFDSGYSAPKEKGKGVLFLNNPHTLHRIVVTQKIPRVILKGSILLNINKLFY